MAPKIIKGGGTDGSSSIGTLDDGNFDAPRKKAAIVSKEEFDAGNDARKIVADAQQKAAQIIADAEAKAQEITEQAQQQADQMKAGAHEEGFKQGSDEAAGKYTQMIAEHSQRMEAKENEVANQIRQLSLAIAKKIIGKELEFNPDSIVDMAKKHLQSIRQRREVYLRVSPADLEHLREAKRELIDQLGRAKEIEIRSDEALTAGSMIIETEAGTIDARIETQMAVIEKVLMGKKLI
jgi:flagellar biosynthesis/type III secretory pathway protein FliH